MLMPGLRLHWLGLSVHTKSAQYGADTTDTVMAIHTWIAQSSQYVAYCGVRSTMAGAQRYLN